MFGRSRLSFLSILFILVMIFGQNPFASHSVQADEFPIGLTMVYDVWVDNFIPPGPAYGYTMEYIVTRWIDEENLLLECNRSIEGVNDTLITTFANITLDIPGYPPIWMNVSSWEVDDIIVFSGEEYQIYETAYTVWNDGYFESYHLFNATNGNGTYASYHSPLGVLTEYGRLSTISNGSTTEVSYGIYLLDTNFVDFFPLLETPPTTTTITTGTTGTTETTGSTTPPPSSIQQTGEPLTGLTLVFGIGIVIEIFVIILFLRQRK
ncbi:MAG: hypothetical protein ACXABN_15980 [Candidatus Thorarchaeota archaeon]|jgi:hypothetical protein